MRIHVQNGQNPLTMAEFLTTSEINASIEKIIRNAKQRIVLISPYIQISEIFADRISEAIKSKVKVDLVFGKTIPKDQQLGLLSLIKGLHISFLEHLHAKCYYNEESMVISSMNFFDFSARNNIEMGVFVDRKTDTALYEAAKREAEYIIDKSDIVEIHMPGRHSGHEDAGFCIRCGASVSYNPLRPLCKSCYNSWNLYGNADYEENFCHSCGDEADTSVKIPECRECYHTNTQRRAV